MKASATFFNILALAFLSMSVSCGEDAQHGMTIRKIKATIERSSTKTALDGPDADGVYKTIWSSEDAIAVFSGDDSATEFKLTSGANTNTAEFEGNAASDNMVAVYPYSIVKGKSGSTISVTLPEVQEYVSGNIPQGAYPMAAVSDGAILPFYNLCSVLRLRMFGDLTVNSITFTPNDTKVKTSGNATVNAADKMLTMSGDAGSTVRLNCANGVKLTKTSTDFLMVVPAQKYTGGFTITISTDHGDVVKAVKSDVTLIRSVLYPVKTFECIQDINRNIVFEDANFKAYLVANFDKNGDGEISRLEALDIIRIKVNTDGISSMAGLEHMPNLTTLICCGSYDKKAYASNGKLEKLDVSLNTKLDTLACNNNRISGTFDVSQCNNLKFFQCTDNKINEIKMTPSAVLEYFFCDGNELETLDLSANTWLLIFSCDDNKLKSLDLSHNVNIQAMSCDNNRLETLDVSKLKNLDVIYCDHNNIKNLDFSHNIRLTNLTCGYNNTENLNVSSNTLLTILECYGNKLKSLDITHNRMLAILECNNNDLETLDISQNQRLHTLYCQDNPLKILYVYKKQIESMRAKTIPDFTQIIENVIKGGNDDTKTGDIIYLD